MDADEDGVDGDDAGGRAQVSGGDEGEDGGATEAEGAPGGGGAERKGSAWSKVLDKEVAENNGQ